MNHESDLEWYAPHGWGLLVPRGTPFERGTSEPGDRVYTDDERRAARVCRALDAMAHESVEGRVSRLVILAWYGQRTAYVLDRARAVLQLLDIATTAGGEPGIPTVWRLEERRRAAQRDRQVALRGKGPGAVKAAKEALAKIDNAEQALALWRAKPRGPFGAALDHVATLLASFDGESDRISWARVRARTEALAAYSRWAEACHGIARPEAVA